MALTTVGTSPPVTGGVDTHPDLNVAAALDAIGGLLGAEQFPTSAVGNKALLAWLNSFGTDLHSEPLRCSSCQGEHNVRLSTVGPRSSGGAPSGTGHVLSCSSRGTARQSGDPRGNGPHPSPAIL